MNLYAHPPLNYPNSSTVNSRKTQSSQDIRIAQLAKQMAFERMMQELDYQRHSTNKKPMIHPTNSVLTESFHVNHILNDVMMRLIHEMFNKSSTPVVSQPRASRKGELLFVKKQNINNDEQHFNGTLFNHLLNNNQQEDPKVRNSSFVDRTKVCFLFRKIN